MLQPFSQNSFNPGSLFKLAASLDYLKIAGSGATKLTYILLFFCIGKVAISQERIQGKVMSVNKTPLQGVTITAQEGKIGTTTMADGSFSIIAKENDILEISIVGYVTRKIKAISNTSMQIIMSAAMVNMDEVILTGYTSQQRREIVGSVASVKTADLTAIPGGTVENMMQGRVAGLFVMNSGDPGAPSFVRLHGTGNFGDVRPLYIIDGVESEIEAINPYDIESFQVLKDAAAYAIYGVRGANGVIVVSTKKGRSGKTKVSYDMYVGYQIPTRRPDFLNPQENANLLWLSKKNSGDTLSNGNPNDKLFGNHKDPVLPDYLFAGPHEDTLYENSPFVEDSLYNLNPDYPPIYQIVRFNKNGTDWFNEMYSPAFSQSHTVSISGGTQKNEYLLSLGYLDQQGTLLNTYLKRYSLRINSSRQITENIEIGENMQVSYSQKLNADLTDVNTAITTSPSQPVFDTRGAYNAFSNRPDAGPSTNPVARRELAKDYTNHQWTVLGNIYASARFLKDFSFKSNFGGVFADRYDIFFSPASYSEVKKNKLSEISAYNSTYTWTNSLQYLRKTQNQSISVWTAIENVRYSKREVGASASNLPFSDPSFWLLSNGDPDTRENYSTAASSAINSYIGRIDYSWKNKYLLTATLRNDGASVFGSASRYGWFPSVGIAWVINEENFMKKYDWIWNMKIRASWGKTGFAGNTDPNNQFTLYGGTAGNAYYDINGVSSGAIQRGYFRVRNGNANTSWQEDIVGNLGLDLIFWNGKLSITTDWYKKESKGLLFPITLPDILGDATAPNVNIGNIKNNGIDIAVGSKGFFSKNWGWDALMTLSAYRNKISKLTDLPYFTDVSGIVRNQVGHPIGSFFGYEVAGIFQDNNDVNQSPAQPAAAPGRFKYRDTNGFDSNGKLSGTPDGKIDDADRVFYGSPNPDFTLGFNLGVFYRNFDLSTFLYGTFGNEVFNLVSRFQRDLSPQSGTGPSGRAALYSSWTPENRNASVPIAETKVNFSNSAVYNSYGVEDGSYLRCKSIIVGYTFPENVLKRIRISRCRIYLQATNLFTLTNYSGLDPEVFNSITTKTGPGDFSFSGVDIGFYPNNQKQFLIGMSIGF